MKKGLRSEKLLQRLAHHPDEKTTKDEAIIKQICTLEEWSKAKNILFYLPIHGEVDLRELFRKFKAEKNFILPRINNENLDLYLLPDLSSTEKGQFNIDEPKKNLKKIKPSEIDIALIPGVVFSDNGHRIGYGKGFYDRLLKETKSLKIGIAYEFQMVKNIEGHDHDVPMDIIINEKKVRRI